MTITVDSTTESSVMPGLIDDDSVSASASDNYASNPRLRFQVAGVRIMLHEEGLVLGSAVAVAGRTLRHDRPRCRVLYKRKLGISLARITLKLSLRAIMSARATIKAKRKDRALMTVQRNVRVDQTKKVQLLLNCVARRVAKKGNRIVVVMAL